MTPRPAGALTGAECLPGIRDQIRCYSPDGGSRLPESLYDEKSSRCKGIQLPHEWCNPEYLWLRQADVNRETDRQITALIHAAMLDRPAAISTLRQLGAVVNHESRQYGTALMVAAQLGHEESARAIVTPHAHSAGHYMRVGAGGQ